MITLNKFKLIVTKDILQEVMIPFLSVTIISIITIIITIILVNKSIKEKLNNEKEIDFIYDDIVSTNIC